MKMDDQRGKQLVAKIESWPREQFEAAQQLVFARVEEFNACIKATGINSFVKEFYEVFDDAVIQEKTLVSCCRGCFSCCRQNVHVYQSEAAVIAEYCEEKGIEIPAAYLKEQLKYGWRELAKTEVGWCVFLKNGECSIYPVRPISCRNYFVISHPKFCDPVAYPSEKGNRVVSKVLLHPLLLGVAFGGIMEERKDEGGSLSEMLLPYAK